MAAINSIAFDKAAYSPGDTITVTVDYVPDTPSVMPAVFTFTGNVVNSGGTVVASLNQDFTVNVPQPAGDKVSVSDTGGRTWAESSDSGSVAVLTATA